MAPESIGSATLKEDLKTMLHKIQVREVSHHLPHAAKDYEASEILGVYEAKDNEASEKKLCMEPTKREASEILRCV